MATLTTRILETKKERILVTLLLALGVPCSAQLGVILGLISGLSGLATFIWLGTLVAVMLLNAPPVLRVYGSKDLIGVELASALAGAYIVALGLSDGLGVGPGPRAVLITRALAEASRLGVAAGAEARTFVGLAGLGNLLVRASDRSADYLLGRRLAEGGGSQQVAADTARTEGARAALAGIDLAGRLRVRMPVLQGVAAVLAGRIAPKEVANLIGDTVAEAE